MNFQGIIGLAAIQARQDRPNSDDPPELAVANQARIARARAKALAVLEELKATDPDFDGLELTTDKLFAYAPPPKEYYRALVDVGISMFQLSAMREMASSQLRVSLQHKVQATGYVVPKNCCNKILFDWQISDIAKATGLTLGPDKINSLFKLQAYARALVNGDELGTPFRISGFISGSAVSIVEGQKPGRHRLFKNSTGYDVFKRNGKQFTMGSFTALIGE